MGKEGNNGIEHIYVFYQGTSMACPHVAGIAALMKSLAGNMTPDAFDAYIQNFAIVNDIGASGRDDFYGFGVIDALKAVQAVQGGASIPSVLQAYPGNLDFGWAADTATITISSTGSDDVPVSMRVKTSPAQADAGYHYVLLLDPDTWDTIGEKGGGR